MPKVEMNLLSCAARSTVWEGYTLRQILHAEMPHFSAVIPQQLIGSSLINRAMPTVTVMSQNHYTIHTRVTPWHE